MKISAVRLHKAWLEAQGLSPEEIKQAAHSAFPDSAQPVAITEVRGTPLFFKQYLLIRLKDRLRARLGISRALKAYDNGMRLHSENLPSPTPVAVLRWPQKYIVATEALQQGATLDRSLRTTLRDAGGEQALRLCTNLGKFVAEMHRKGVYHSDLHDRNI